jgi:outer membrane protein assembly factor BamA
MKHGLYPHSPALIPALCCGILILCGNTCAGQAVFRDSGRIYSISILAVHQNDLNRILETSLPLAAVNRMLDSLGFFSSTQDSSSRDTMRIVPGNRFHIDSVSVAGVPSFIGPVPDWGLLPIPYDALIVSQWAKALVRLLATRGYPFATVSTAVSPCQGAGCENQDCIRFEVGAGMRYSFGNAAFGGTFKTRPRMLERDLTFHRGGIFNSDRVDESTERLLSREYIANVSALAPRPLPDSETTGRGVAFPDSAARGRVIVPFLIADRSGLGLDGALAFSTAEGASGGLNGAIDFSLVNIFGLGERAHLAYSGDKTQSALDITIGASHVFGYPLFPAIGFGLEIRENEYGNIHGTLDLLWELRTRWSAGISLKALETTVQTPKPQTWQYGGGSLVIIRTPEPNRMGKLTRELRLETGTGIADRPAQSFQRANVNLIAGLHAPFFRCLAVSLRVASDNMFTQEDSLSAAELYRVGGYQSIRGYADNEFSFRNDAYVQAEYLFYFAPAGALYLFSDGGIGLPDGYTIPTRDYIRLFGYGLGIRIPSRIGDASVEWARSIDDTKSLGRIHVRIRNALAMAAAGRK